MTTILQNIAYIVAYRSAVSNDWNAGLAAMSVACPTFEPTATTCYELSQEILRIMPDTTLELLTALDVRMTAYHSEI